MSACSRLGLLALFALASVAEAGPYAGRSLSDALVDLGSRGLRIVFTSQVVTPEMRVAEEPVAFEPRRILDELLAPHGLMVREGRRGTLIVVPRPDSDPDRDPGAVARIEHIEFQETVVVTPSRISMLRDEPGAAVAFSQEQIDALPHLGDDFFRAVSLVPGVASNDVAARFHVRGGRRDETQILLDGQELFDPYHLKDFDGALSFVSASALSRAELTTGGFPVEFGDRMAGVLDMRTATPSGGPRVHVGLSATNLNAGGGGSFDEGRASWLAEARRGTGDLLEALIGNENPRYADAYAKLESRFHPRHALACQVLYSDDEFQFAESKDGDSKLTDTDYQDAYVWLTHRAILGESWLVATSLSQAILDQDRRGTELEEQVQFDITDRRRTEVRGLRQDWLVRGSPRQLFKWGFELREFETDYDYDGSSTFQDPLASIGHSSTDVTSFHDRFEEHHVSVYVADRLRPAEAVTLELGLRHDVWSLTDESQTSPRFNGVWSPHRTTAIRLGWGRFLQSQRTYELQVEDGETSFYPTERSEHRILGFERWFGDGPAPGGLTLRVELYERRIDNPRPRYENLYEALNTFPEVEPDRVRIAPDRSRARGVEVFLQGRPNERLGWFANYAYSRAVDSLDGYEAPRSIDQRHALNLDLDTRIGRHWRLNLAWRYHTGWPTTPLSVQQVKDDRGEIVYEPVLGPLNSDRLDPYHRLDARASRQFQPGRGRLDLFIDVQNVYDRDNVAGFDIELDEETGAIKRTTEYWTGILPSAGLTYEF